MEEAEANLATSKKQQN